MACVQVWGGVGQGGLRHGGCELRQFALALYHDPRPREFFAQVTIEARFEPLVTDVAAYISALRAGDNSSLRYALSEELPSLLWKAKLMSARFEISTCPIDALARSI